MKLAHDGIQLSFDIAGTGILRALRYSSDDKAGAMCAAQLRRHSR